MNLVRLYPWNNLDQVQRQMNHLFDNLLEWENHNPTSWRPAIELLDNAQSLILRAVLPGMVAKDLEITATRDRLKIAGERQRQTEHEDKGYYVSEFHYGKFERVINLPTEIDPKGIHAEFKDGILSLTLPKVVEEKESVVKIRVADEAIAPEN